MLLEVERVVGVEDDVGLFFVDHHRHRKVSQTGAALASDCPPRRETATQCSSINVIVMNLCGTKLRRALSTAVR
jgi:hypothetical protein